MAEFSRDFIIKHSDSDEALNNIKTTYARKKNKPDFLFGPVYRNAIN